MKHHTSPSKHAAPSKLSSFKSLFKLLAPFLLIIVFCICLTPRPLQNDTYYLVKIGDRLWNQGMDFKDHYTYLADLTYTYPHFLFNLLCFAFHSLLGWEGLYILSILLYLLFAFSLFSCLRFELRRFLSAHPNLAASTQSFVKQLPLLLTLLSVTLVANFITARSHVLTYTIFIWELFFLARLLETQHKKYLGFLAFLSWLVAIAHATIWPFFFILFLPFAAELILQKFFKNSSLVKNRTFLTSLTQKFHPLPAYKKGTIKSFLLALLASLTVGLLTPARICYTAIFKIMQGSSQSYISEHAPLVLKNCPEAAVILLLLLALLIFTKAKLRPRDFFLLIGFTLLSFVAVRHVAFLLTLAFPPLCRLLFDWSTHVNPTFFNAILKFTPASLLLFACLVLVSLNFATELSKPLHDPTIAPEAAVAFLKSHYPSLSSLDLNATRAVDQTPQIRLFNEYNIGAYLLANDLPVSIDSRVNIYTKPFSTQLESDLFEDYKEINSGSAEGFELIKKYRLTTFLLYKDTALAKVLAHDPAYTELYSDDDFVIYENPSFLTL